MVLTLSRYSFHTELCFVLCVNTPVPACLIQYPARYCMIIHPLWLKMSSCNEQLAIRLMPLLARRVPWKHILHIMISLIRGAYNPDPFSLFHGRHCHNLISFLSSFLSINTYTTP